jgi:hypothetical protein
MVKITDNSKGFAVSFLRAESFSEILVIFTISLPCYTQKTLQREWITMKDM